MTQGGVILFEKFLQLKTSKELLYVTSDVFFKEHSEFFQKK